tara:strand:+ start:3156 stop:4091 length:936 start_codon:yes stop_codon:yes gene_type:complete
MEQQRTQTQTQIKFSDVSFNAKKTKGGFGSIQFGICNQVPVVVKRCKIRNKSEHIDSETEAKIWAVLSETEAVPVLLGHGKLNKKSMYHYTRYFICEDTKSCDLHDFINMEKHWVPLRENGSNDSGKKSSYGVLDDNGIYEYTMPRKIKIHASKKMAKALLDMQSLGYVHRDIKCENFIVDDLGSCVHLIDFGLSDESECAIAENIVVGTPAYCDPCVEDDGWSSNKSDVYSLGIVFIRLWLGYMGKNFDAYNETHNDPRTKLSLRKELMEQLTLLEKKEPSISYLIRKMLSVKLEYRFDISQVHNFLTKF